MVREVKKRDHGNVGFWATVAILPESRYVRIGGSPQADLTTNSPEFGLTLDCGQLGM